MFCLRKICVLKFAKRILKEKEELNKEVSLLKTSSEVTVREKPDLAKENQDLSKQLESLGRKFSIETSSEHTTSEKDARLQTLEKTLAKERCERILEKEKRLTAQAKFLEEKKNLEDEIAKLKQAIAASERTGMNAAQLPSQGALDEHAFSSVDKFEEVVTKRIKENQNSLTSVAPSSELWAIGQSSTPSRPRTAESVGSTDKMIDTAKSPERRLLVRPPIDTPEEPQANREGQRREEAAVGTSHEPPSSSSDASVPKLGGRKRPVSSLQSIADTAAEDAADVPPLKKWKKIKKWKKMEDGSRPLKKRKKMEDGSRPLKKRKKMEDGGVELLEEMTEEILVRLEAKALCRLRLVSKRWRAIIKDPRFVAAHAAHAPQQMLALQVAGPAGPREEVNSRRHRCRHRQKQHGVAGDKSGGGSQNLGLLQRAAMPAVHENKNREADESSDQQRLDNSSDSRVGVHRAGLQYGIRISPGNQCIYSRPCPPVLGQGMEKQQIRPSNYVCIYSFQRCRMAKHRPVVSWNALAWHQIWRCPFP